METIDVLDFTSPQSQECENELAKAMDLFRKQYPSVTSGDLQTFILGFRMGWFFNKKNKQIPNHLSNEEPKIQNFPLVELKNPTNPKLQ